MAELRISLESLTAFPLSGPSREHLALNLRARFHGAYVIYYTPTNTEVIVVRVLHGSRDIQALADRGGLSLD